MSNASRTPAHLRSRLRLFAASVLGTTLVAGLTLRAAPPPPRKATPSTRIDPCASLTDRTSYRYVVTGRARPLIIWTGRHDVGAARITRATGSAGDQRIDLLIGTDPERAPMHVNRWGYTSEATCEGRTQVVGLMTQSDEETIEAATVSVGATAGATHQYRAVRGIVTAGAAQTEMLRVSTDRSFTHRDLDEMLNLLPLPGAMRSSTVPTDVAPGFLLAMAEELAATPRAARQRTYVYSGVLYTLQRSASEERVSAAIGASTYERVLDTAFETRNRLTGEVTRFQVTSGTAATGTALAGVPLRVVYRPRWWLELELVLDAVQR